MHISRPTQRAGLNTAGATSDQIVRAVRDHSGQPCRRARLERRLSPAVLSRATGSGARHRTSRECCQVALQKGIPTLVEFFGRDTARSLPSDSRGRSVDWQQRARPRPGSQRLRRRDEDPAQARRRDHDGVPASDATDRRASVRHHLPRALQLLLFSHGRVGSSRLTGCACSTSRNCRRTAAPCASTAATPMTTRTSRTRNARPSWLPGACCRLRGIWIRTVPTRVRSKPRSARSCRS